MATVATLQNRVSRVSTEFASLDAAVAALGASNAVLTLAPGDTKTLTDDLTIPANVTLSGQMGVIATNGHTLTVNGPVVAGRWRVFDAAPGEVVLSGVDAVLPDWWGPDDSGATLDWADAINSALQSVSSVKASVDLVGAYRVKSTIYMGAGQHLRGHNAGRYNTTASRIVADVADIAEGAPIVAINADTTTDTADAVIEGILFRGDNETVVYNNLAGGVDTGLIGVDVSGTKNGLIIRDCAFRNLKTGIGQRSGGGSVFATVRIQSCTITNCYTGISITSTTPVQVTDTDVRECVIWGRFNRAHIKGGTWENSSVGLNSSNVSFSQVGVVEGVWFEGGARQVWAESGATVTCVGCHFGDRRPATAEAATYGRCDAGAHLTFIGCQFRLSNMRQVTIDAGSPTSCSVQYFGCTYDDAGTAKRYAYFPNSTQHPYNLGVKYTDDVALDYLTRRHYLGHYTYFHGDLAQSAAVTVDVADIGASPRMLVTVTGQNNDNTSYVLHRAIVVGTNGNLRSTNIVHTAASGVTVAYALSGSIIQMTLTNGAGSVLPLKEVTVVIESLNGAIDWNRAPKLRRDMIDAFVDSTS